MKSKIIITPILKKQHYAILMQSAVRQTCFFCSLRKEVKEEMLFELFIKWLVPFLLGAAVTFTGTMLLRIKAIKNGLQCLLRSEIIRSYDKYKEKKFAPVYAKEALTKAYSAYHALGGNDVATALYNETMELPTEPSAGRK